MLARHIILFVSYTACLVQAQAQRLTLSILPDPSFNLLSGEIIVSQQLNSWGIKLGPISLGLDIDLSALGLKKREATRSRSRSRTRARLLHPITENDNKTDERREERRLLGLDLGLLNLGLNFGGSKTAQQSKSSSKALINLNLDADLSGLFSWGDADNVARGERGDTEWFTYISIGTPPQSLPILPDTGSSDLFVFGPTCSSCNLYNHTSFDPHSSSTYKNTSGNWAYYYADGSGAMGYTSSDMVSFGEDQTVVRAQMDIAIATAVAGSDFRSSMRSGVMGLGLDAMSTIKSIDEARGKTLFSRLVKSKSLSENVLGIRLTKGRQARGVVYEEGQGQYTFGGIEENYLRGGREGLAGITMEDISVGSNSILSQDRTTPRRAIIDTGTTLIITSDSASSMIHSNIIGSWQDPKSSLWYIPCSTSYPSTGNVFFTISGRKSGVPIEDLAWKRSNQFDGMCISGVQGGMEGFTVLGDMFIKNHYVVLSYGSEANGGRIQVGLGDRTDVLPIL
uniref:Peptidase A1 domain-containing protein n=1 Tax=Kwoniella bestiolae CBS 10118 TaxID=1296100 RepID=A0A1B9G9V9_9TREE|nr:hypothetical protein I302_02671 [Kwoniella bestiolae CBS 10118]OCF27822.1 hypothetical protein I302_02671 [Kwoniella bestiolae CBS 10118]